LEKNQGGIFGSGLWMEDETGGRRLPQDAAQHAGRKRQSLKFVMSGFVFKAGRKADAGGRCRADKSL